MSSLETNGLFPFVCLFVNTFLRQSRPTDIVAQSEGMLKKIDRFCELVFLKERTWKALQPY